MLPTLAALLVAIPQAQQGQATPTASITATRAAEAPHIDGRADDPVWKTAAKVGGFRQFDPRVDSAPAFPTEFQVAFDEKNLYVFVRMFDPHPDSILHALSRRDVRGPSDQIKVLIDSYDDKRSGYELAVNPDGVKRDFSMSNDGNEDGSWNGVWDVATRVDSAGWTAEYRIPLSQLRYARADAHTFGFGVWRDIERFKERSSWPLYNPKVSGLSSQLGRLTGLEGLSSARRIEATPYVVTKNVQQQKTAGAYSLAQQQTVGGDLKLGITSNVTLDATVNPDFGQVEADPAVVNLSAFETFFSERRPFFVEGTSLYQFSLNCYIVVDCSTNEGLFYSRRVGRSPALRGLYGDALTATATPITGAAKITGRLRQGLSFGALDATTPRVGGANNRTVEPRANYAVVRAQQDLRGGQAGFSVIGTAVNRSMDTSTTPYLHESAYVGGASVRNRFHQGQYELNGQLAASRVMASRQAIARTQQNSVHYFQQPNDDLVVDTMRTELTGHAEQIKFGKYGGGITRFETSLVNQSAGFDVNDLGFLRRGDKLDWSTWGQLNFRDPRGIYRWASVNGNYWTNWNSSGTRLDNSTNFNGHMGLRNNWDVHLGATFANLGATWCDRCTRGGPVTRNSRGFYPWGGFNTDSRRTVSGGFWVNYNYGDEGKSTGTYYSPYLTFKLSTQLAANVSLNYSDATSAAQWFGNFTTSGTTHYTFAHLDQEVVGTTVRVNYTVTPDLTFEFYGAPFRSTRTYSDFRELSANPGADAFDDRLMPYAMTAGTQTTFKDRQLRTNSVARWEFRPGSTLFVVWAHGRQDGADLNSTKSWMRDYRDLLDLHPDNTFLVKLAYWLNR